jgi:hypothetical protein
VAGLRGDNARIGRRLRGKTPLLARRPDPV